MNGSQHEQNHQHHPQAKTVDVPETCDFFECRYRLLGEDLAPRHSLARCTPAQQTAAGAYVRTDIEWGYMADYPEPGAVLIYVCDPENPEAGGMHLALSLTRSNLILLRDTASNALGSERS